MANATDVTVVTGGNGALGSALVQRFGAEPGKVIAVERGKSSEPKLTRIAANIVRLEANVADAALLREALALAEADVGAVTAAVLTAGAWRGGNQFTQPEAAADFRVVMDANLESANVALRALLPGLVKRRRGSVVLLGSLSGARPHTATGAAAYAAAKAALTALAQAIAAEVLADGVRLNVVLPSTIDTEVNRHAMPRADPSRWVTTDSLGDVIGFLLSDAARDVSGAAVPVYGRVDV